MECITNALGIAPVAIPGIVTGSQLAKDYPHAVVGFERRPVVYVAILMLAIAVTPFVGALVIGLLRALD
jgi:hypothetical protein